MDLQEVVYRLDKADVFQSVLAGHETNRGYDEAVRQNWSRI